MRHLVCNPYLWLYIVVMLSILQVTGVIESGSDLLVAIGAMLIGIAVGYMAADFYYQVIRRRR